ncbi:MAG: preprotein translocase subunit SecA [Pirellulaceae bacterium]|nr:preprotein translocase subunit SecA [Pirellulaceae bacterium]
MEVLEKSFDAVSGFFSGLLRGFEKGVTAVFGSSNARTLKKYQGRVEAINQLESRFASMSNEELVGQTQRFKDRLAAGETLDDLLPEAFAVCREGGKRFIGLRHYDVQLIGGMVLHGGNVAEMVTGEGKTLVATLPAYLNALTGKGVHIVTVNDYLARRDMEWMAPLYMGLGLTVGTIQSDMRVADRQMSYDCNITYGTNNEFGFDYLRDNMRPAARGDHRFPRDMQQCQGPLHYAIIDEVDNILIDEARTPLIISGPAHQERRLYQEANRIAQTLKKGIHFNINEKDHAVTLTDEGVREAERLAGVESFYTAGNMEWPHLVDNALKANYLYKNDVNYVVKDNGVVIVDEFTGRLMEGRQWSDGLHQAVEAKEGVRIKEETQTLATITLQNYFKLYEKLSGMTGTALTEAPEFWKIYKLDVVAIPTNRPMKRTEKIDLIYATEQGKWKAVAEEVEAMYRHDFVETNQGHRYLGKITEVDDKSVTIVSEGKPETFERRVLTRVQKKNRPLLIGTNSIEKSELLSTHLQRRNIPHEVLNAKNHRREAEIIAQAGRIGAITIATNMAGRGTDIVLGGNPENMAWAQLQDKYRTRLDVPRDEWNALVEEIAKREKMKEEGEIVKQMGGLCVIGTERNDARRIDLQLRGRCGRQGDPGDSQFFLSLEDDLMRIFGGAFVQRFLGSSLGEDALQSKMLCRRLDAAQKKREEMHFEARKNLLEYDEVMDEQRKRVYRYRQQILNGVNCRDLIVSMIQQQIEYRLEQCLESRFGCDMFAAYASSELRLGKPLEGREFRGMEYEAALDHALDQAVRVLETELLASIDENLPDGDEDAHLDWNWNAMANVLKSRWKIDTSERELQKVGRENLAEVMLERGKTAIHKTDLREGALMLNPDYGRQVGVRWLKDKFGVLLDLDEVSRMDSAKIVTRATNDACRRYDHKEATYPLIAAMSRFAKDETGLLDREALMEWASRRFNAQLTVEQITGLQRSEIFQFLLEYSLKSQKVGQEVEEKLGNRLNSLKIETVKMIGDLDSELVQLTQWLSQEVDSNLDAEDLRGMKPERVKQQFNTWVQDRFHPEMRRMERMVLLEIVDSAWKDHLSAMDHLRSAVGQRGMAALDPKVEYKREGKALFDRLWDSIGERVTDLVFRVEHLNDQFVKNTLVDNRSRAVEIKREAATESMPIGKETLRQQQAIEAAQQNNSEAKPQTVRSSGVRVGRNDPCPCGSGKKHKSCCMKND